MLFDYKIFLNVPLEPFEVVTSWCGAEGKARPTDQSVAQAIRALSPLRAGGSAGVWFDNTMLERYFGFEKTFCTKE